VVEGGGRDADQDLAFAWGGLGDIFELETCRVLETSHVKMHFFEEGGFLRVVDLPRLAAFDVTEVECLWHLDDLHGNNRVGQ
jgi:hypothetical protein